MDDIQLDRACKSTHLVTAEASPMKTSQKPTTLISMAASLQTTSDFPSRKQVFIPQESLDHPFDVTLVVQDEKEFKAHRRVLSKASPFFEKLLNSDMRESNEGVARLQMLAEPCLRDILEFIYTGSVQISAEDNAQELIAMADYLVLPHLKTLAENCLVMSNKLNDSNAISTYYFGERYRCEDSFASAKTSSWQILQQ